ncbi:MAG: type II toxin-antitoxin system RelE family toxin [Terriglobales bacterium]
MAYDIQFRPAALRSLRKLPIDIQHRMADALEDPAQNPIPPGAKRLHGPERWFRIRIGEYRVIYDVQHARLLVLVIEIGHRREVYR